MTNLGRKLWSVKICFFKSSIKASKLAEPVSGMALHLVSMRSMEASLIIIAENNNSVTNVASEVM